METPKLEPYFSLDLSDAFIGDVNLYVWQPSIEEYAMQQWYSPPGSKRNRRRKQYAVWTELSEPVAFVDTEEEARAMCLALAALER